MDKHFIGLWVGESMGTESSPAHLWRVRQDGRNLYIYHRWEGETAEHRNHMWALVSEDGRSFGFDRDETKGKRALILDDEHFVIPGWDTNDIRGGVGPAFDVVFSRPGVPELQSRPLWEAWQASKAEAA